MAHTKKMNERQNVVIRVYANGNMVVARMWYYDKERRTDIERTARAFCCPEDEFDFAKGAEIATKRLFDGGYMRNEWSKKNE